MKLKNQLKLANDEINNLNDIIIKSNNNIKARKLNLVDFKNNSNSNTEAKLLKIKELKSKISNLKVLNADDEFNKIQDEFDNLKSSMTYNNNVYMNKEIDKINKKFKENEDIEIDKFTVKNTKVLIESEEKLFNKLIELTNTENDLKFKIDNFNNKNVSNNNKIINLFENDENLY